MKKTYIFFLIFCSVSKLSFGQTYSSKEQYDLLKYWNLRDRMDLWVKQGYVDVHNNCPTIFGKTYGYNLVPSHLTIWERNAANTPVPSSTDIDLFRLKFGDGGHYLGWYISVLATEYELIRRNGLKAADVLEELFNSMETVYRLDALAENLPPYNHKSNYAGCHPNGYFVRSDVRHYMLGGELEWYDLSDTPNELDDADPDADNDGGPKNAPDCGDYLGETPGTAAGCDNAMSRDQVAHIFMGLALVKRYLPDQALYFNGRAYNFHQKAKDFTHAIMRRLFVDRYSIIMPKFDKLVTRGKRVGAAKYAYRKAALWIEDKGAKHYCRNVVSNPFNGKKHCPGQAYHAAVYYAEQAIMPLFQPFTRALNLAVGTVGRTYGAYNPIYLQMCYNQGHDMYQLLHHAIHNNSVVFNPRFVRMLESMDCYGPRQYDTYIQPYPSTPLIVIRVDKQNSLVSPNDPTKPHPRFSNGTADSRWQFSDRFNAGNGNVGRDNNNRQFVGLDYMLLHNLFTIWAQDVKRQQPNFTYRNYEENDVRHMQYPVGPNKYDWGSVDNPAFEYSFKKLVATNSVSQPGSIVVFESAIEVDTKDGDFQGEFDARVVPFDCANHSGPVIQLNKTSESLEDTVISGNPESITYLDLLKSEFGEDLDFMMNWFVENDYTTTVCGFPLIFLSC